jgi:hypothetical protein
VASRKNEDGSVTFVTITPGADGYELDVAAGPEGRRLIIREAPRVYAFSEVR